jgi:hypothetical protein
MVDPATRKMVMAQAARTLPLFAPKGFLVLRTPVDLDEDERKIPGFKGPESHQYKDDMFVYLYMPDRSGEAASAEKADA